MDEPFGALDYVTRMGSAGSAHWICGSRTTARSSSSRMTSRRRWCWRSGSSCCGTGAWWRMTCRFPLPRPRDEAVRASPAAVETYARSCAHLGLRRRTVSRGVKAMIRLRRMAVLTARTVDQPGDGPRRATSAGRSPAILRPKSLAARIADRAAVGVRLRLGT